MVDRTRKQQVPCYLLNSFLFLQVISTKVSEASLHKWKVEATSALSWSCCSGNFWIVRNVSRWIEGFLLPKDSYCFGSPVKISTFRIASLEIFPAFSCLLYITWPPLNKVWIFSASKGFNLARSSTRLTKSREVRRCGGDPKFYSM